jgi:hypothetical protein
VARTDITRVRQLCEQLVQRAEADPNTASAFAEGLARLLDDAAAPKRKLARRTGRRDAPVLDPFEVFREDPAALRDRLSELDLEQLRDVVAFYGMDPRRLVMKWKTSDRVIAHIIETVRARSRKGDVFRVANAAG